MDGRAEWQERAPICSRAQRNQSPGRGVLLDHGRLSASHPKNSSQPSSKMGGGVASATNHRRYRNASVGPDLGLQDRVGVCVFGRGQTSGATTGEVRGV